MPRPARAFGLSDLVSGQLVSSPYICRSCRHLALRQRLASQPSLRHASSAEIPFAEKVRRKIWAKDNTPGLEDPYDGESFLERRRKERARQKEAQELKALEEENATQRVAPSGRKPRAIDGDRGSDYIPKEYAPSETWDGLEHVGHKGHWRDVPPQPEDEFDAFLATAGLKATKPEHFLAAIHQAIVEIITLQQARKDLNLSTLAKGWYPEIQELIAQTTVEIGPGKAPPKLKYPTENTRGIITGWFLKKQREQLWKDAESIAADAEEVGEAADLLDENKYISTIAATADKHLHNAAEMDEAIVAEDEKLAERQRRDFEVQHGRHQDSARTTAPAVFYEGVEAPAFGANQAFLDMKLDFKEEQTYFLFRRIAQLTGLRIPDPVLAKSKTLRSIYIYQLQAIKPKPKNLAETLTTRAELASLPNVKIMSRRETPVDKEKAAGRWKVIEAELRSRGLPVLGRAEV